MKVRDDWQVLEITKNSSQEMRNLFEPIIKKPIDNVGKQKKIQTKRHIKLYKSETMNFKKSVPLSFIEAFSTQG